jgi:glycosyltransferase involved in cell wall biosynthesis
VLAVSRETADRCTSRYAVDPAKLVVVPNAVDLEHFRPRERGAVRSVLGLPEDVPIVAFLGHFIDRKGPLRVLEALRRAPDARAIFLGHGPQQPEGEQVLHAERCPHALVPHYLCAADVFVLPTRSEGSPNAILEALACGLPVVSSDIPSVREVVSKSCGELVDPMDVRALGDAIARLLEDAPRRATMSEAAREHASGFSLERRAQRILSWMSEARR